VSYLIVAAALAISRVALLVWVNEPHHPRTDTEWYLMRWGLSPETFLSTHTGVGVMHLSRAEFFLIFGSLLTFTSFVMATPILLVGWLMRRRR